jgi:hypothetical protein
MYNIHLGWSEAFISHHGISASYVKSDNRGTEGDHGMIHEILRMEFTPEKLAEVQQTGVRFEYDEGMSR